MPMNLPQPTLNLDTFRDITATLARDDSERIAETFPDLFKTAFEYGSAPKSDPPKPLAKTSARTPRERTSNLSAEEQAAASHVVDFMKRNPGTRSRDIITTLDGRSKSRVLAWLVVAKMLSVQGKAAGARYYPVNGTPETGAAPEQAE